MSYVKTSSKPLVAVILQSLNVGVTKSSQSVGDRRLSNHARVTLVNFPSLFYHYFEQHGCKTKCLNQKLHRMGHGSRPLPRT
ncbi:hypothetical protein BH18ACI4_BH18ACI4_03840 [soil metagenome]